MARGFSRVGLAACLIAGPPSACATRARGHDATALETSRHDGESLDATMRATDASSIARNAVRARRPEDVRPAFTIASGSTSARLDPSERLRVPDGAGHTILPGDPDPTARAAPPGTPLFPGDRIDSGEGEVLLVDAMGRRFTLGADSSARIPPFGGSDVILTRGEGVVHFATQASAAFVMDTPALRARLTLGEIRCMVPDDGHTVCAASEAPVEVWPSPPSPASLLRGPIDPRARSHGRHAHPISLDVQVADLDTSARPLIRIVLAPGQFVLYGPDGGTSSRRPAGSGDVSLRRWRAQIEHLIARPEGHLYSVSQLARAGTGDLADARALSAVPTLEPPLAAGGSDGGLGAVTRIAADLDDADARTFRLSAALGRAFARADRARSLALRGGDVTVLVPMARLDEVTEAARASIPPRASMLDSQERPHVP